MSAATKAALDEALSAHLADEMEGAILGNYIVQMRGTVIDGEDDGASAYFWATADQQPLDITLGLVRYCQIQHEQNAVR